MHYSKDSMYDSDIVAICGLVINPHVDRVWKGFGDYQAEKAWKVREDNL